MMEIGSLKLIRERDAALQRAHRAEQRIGELLQALGARESEARQAVEAMQSLDVCYATERAQLTASLTALRGALRDFGQHRSGCAVLPREFYGPPGSPFGHTLPPASAMCDCGLFAVLAASRVPHQEDTNDDLARTGETSSTPPPQPALTVPALLWEYVGEELALFWESPYGHGKEKIASFWWPAHPVEATADVERLFETIADGLTRTGEPGADRPPQPAATDTKGL